MTSQYSARLSPSAFELAWRLRPALWVGSRYETSRSLDTKDKKEARAVLVGGAACTEVPRYGWNGHRMGPSRLRSLCRDLLEQLECEVG